MKRAGPGDPIDAALVRASARRKLFGDEAPTVRIGRFVVERRIGGGAMGVVYAAHDPDLDRKVAIKLLHEADDPDAEEPQLMREARALARLRHRNVVVIHDVGTWNDQIYLAMEHLTGANMRAWMAADERSWRDVAEVMCAAGRGLAAAHRAGIIHRDFKPDNVVVDSPGEVRVVDFGLARAEHETADGPSAPAPSRSVLHTLTSVGGTPAYLAPECLGGAVADARSDQYSFCVTLYEALVGERPDGARDASTAPKLPKHVRRILARGLAPEPGDRFASMDELVTALSRDPAARVRTIATVAGVALAAAAITFGATRRSGDGDADPCGEQRARLAGVWDADRRAEVERAFRASERPFASAALDSVIESLDGYADAWTGGARDTCEASVVRRDQSDALRDLRARCLDRRLAALDGAVTLFAAGGDDVIERGVRIIESLPGVEACADRDALSAPLPPPDDPASRERLAALEARLPKPAVLAAATRFTEAVESATALVDDARALGYRPLLAEALFALGSAEAASNQRAPAIASWREALLEGQASGAADVVAGAAERLGRAERRDRERAREWLALAYATIERAGSPPRLLAAYHDTMAILDAREEKFTDAVAHGEKAVAASEAAGRTETLAHASYLHNLANILDSAGRFDDALSRLDEALALRKRLLGATHPDLGHTYNLLGVVEERLGHWERALQHYRDAYAVREALGQSESAHAANYLDHQAGPLRRMGRFDEAREKLERALAIREKVLPAGHPDIANSYTNLGVFYQTAGDLSSSLAMHEKSLALRTAVLEPDDYDIALSEANLGEMLVLIGRPAEGLPHCERGRSILAGKLGAEHPDLIFYDACIGRAQRDTGKLAAATQTLERGLAIAEASSGYPSDGALLRFVFAQTLWDLGRDRARARALAQLAATTYGDLGDPAAAEVEAWLAAHRATR